MPCPQKTMAKPTVMWAAHTNDKVMRPNGAKRASKRLRLAGSFSSRSAVRETRPMNLKWYRVIRGRSARGTTTVSIADQSVPTTSMPPTICMTMSSAVLTPPHYYAPKMRKPDLWAQVGPSSLIDRDMVFSQLPPREPGYGLWGGPAKAHAN